MGLISSVRSNTSQVLQYLSGFLFGEHEGPLWRYCLIAFPLALLPSFALLTGVVLAFLAVGVDISGLMRPAISATWSDFFGSVVFAPIVETLVLAVLLRVLFALTPRKILVVSASALLWGCLHASLGVLAFFGTAWSFFVFSCTFLVWRKKSFPDAFIAAAAPHALVNFTVIICIAIADIA